MKNSSVAERIIAGLVTILVAIMGFVAVVVWNMNSDFGVVMFHINNHPNIAIEADVSELERWRNEHTEGHPR